MSLSFARQRLTNLMPNGVNHRKEFDHAWVVDGSYLAVDSEGNVEREEVFPDEPEKSEPVAELPPEPKPNPLLIEVRAKYWLERYRNYQEVRPREDWDKAAVLADEELARFDKRFPQ